MSQNNNREKNVQVSENTFNVKPSKKRVEKICADKMRKTQRKVSEFFLETQNFFFKQNSQKFLLQF